MNHVPMIWDSLELTAVFLLAAEAIKLQNLAWIRSRTVTLLRVVNPQIEFVDELPQDLKFSHRHAIELYLIGIYVLGIAVILGTIHEFDCSLSILVPGSVIGWILFVLGILMGPLLVGMLLYTAMIWLLQRVITGLMWVEVNTRTGAVGILGFILFLTQFIGRRVFAL